MADWRPLRGTRYADDTNRWLQNWIQDELPYLDMGETMARYRVMVPHFRDKDWALLGCNDRFFLLTAMSGRKDAQHPWLFDRSREVERNPDDCLDLWARDHYKSTIITFSGAIQEIVADPEITIGLFSFNQKIARAFVKQVKREFEQNDLMKSVYADVLYADPANESPYWTDAGFICKRATNPKEATLEGWGLVTGQPTSKHYALRIYDDVVTRESVTNEDMIRNTTEAWELSDNLGGRDQRKWHIGTRYHFGDTYGVILGRGLLKPRLFPATTNGKLEGEPVFLRPEVWEKKKKTQASQVAAQMLQNPTAGNETVFKPEWLRPYVARPKTLTVYITVDPSKGKSARSDRTAIAVIGIDSSGNKYLLDGYRHRMPVSERWTRVRDLYKHWTRQPGVQMVSVGWERYGLQTDDEYVQERMQLEGIAFPIKELNWTRDGAQSKKDRVERLEPDMQHSRFFVPFVVWQPGVPLNLWSINTDKGQVDLRPLGKMVETSPGKSMFQVGATRQMEELKRAGDEWRIARPLIRKDETGQPYDLTRAFMEEVIFFPFGTHDDLVDAVSRIYDMDPIPPAFSESPEAMEAHHHDFEDA